MTDHSHVLVTMCFTVNRENLQGTFSACKYKTMPIYISNQFYCHLKFSLHCPSTRSSSKQWFCIHNIFQCITLLHFTNSIHYYTVYMNTDTVDVWTLCAQVNHFLVCPSQCWCTLLWFMKWKLIQAFLFSAGCHDFQAGSVWSQEETQIRVRYRNQKHSERHT